MGRKMACQCLETRRHDLILATVKRRSPTAIKTSVGSSIEVEGAILWRAKMGKWFILVTKLKGKVGDRMQEGQKQTSALLPTNLSKFAPPPT
jgi:hypothetical protein